MRPLAFVDLETTGATATVDRITEIGIIEVDTDGTTREWQQLVNPGVSIPPFIEQLTGISNSMVAEAPAFETVAAETLRRLEGRLFIAHNARFDYSFLKNEFKRIGVTFRAPVVCTVKLSRALFPEHKRHNLDSLIERHGLAADARHRALADAQLIHQFWQKVHAACAASAIDAALQAQNARPSLPPQLDPGFLDDLPDGHGVYLFYGENALPLYVGKARNLRQRVLSHFAADHSSAREMDLAQQIRRIDWIETAGEIGALLKEASLVKQLQPIANRLLRRNNDVCTWTLVDEGEGWLRPQLALANDLDFGIRSACYGLFKSSKEASEVLRALAAEHRLCDALLGLEKTAPGKPCFGYQIKRCKGTCIGAEPYARHTMRLVGGLTRLKLVSWPVDGPALIREGEEAHLIDGWRYLGTARSDEELHALQDSPRPPFDRDIYKLLAKHVGRLNPLPRNFTKSMKSG
jgi:DNA polymerase III subunit epsilon